MGVITRYMSEFDKETVFENKKDADAHDKKIAATSTLKTFIETQVPNIDSDSAKLLVEQISINAEAIIKTLKGKPQDLINIMKALSPTNSDNESGILDSDGLVNQTKATAAQSDNVNQETPADQDTSADQEQMHSDTETEAA